MRRSSLNRSYAGLCGEGTALTSGGTAADRDHRHNHAIGIIIEPCHRIVPVRDQAVPLACAFCSRSSAFFLARSSIRTDCCSMTSSARASSSSADAPPANGIRAPSAPARTPAAAVTNHSKHCRHPQIMHPARRVAAVGHARLCTHRHRNCEDLPEHLQAA